MKMSKNLLAITIKRNFILLSKFFSVYTSTNDENLQITTKKENKKNDKVKNARICSRNNLNETFTRNLI